MVLGIRFTMNQKIFWIIFPSQIVVLEKFATIGVCSSRCPFIRGWISLM